MFQGLLFQGEAKSKSWTPLVAGQVAVTLVSHGDEPWLEATKGSEKVQTRVCVCLWINTVVCVCTALAKTVLFCHNMQFLELLL